jgi:hypothetical protein
LIDTDVRACSVGQTGSQEKCKRYKEEVGQNAGGNGMPGSIDHGTPLLNGFNETHEF